MKNLEKGFAVRTEAVASLRCSFTKYRVAALQIGIFRIAKKALACIWVFYYSFYY